MNKQYDLSVVIGRFQPLHNGHVALIEAAQELATNTLVLIGSYNSPTTIKNPFTYSQCAEMIRSVFAGPTVPYISGIEDSAYNNEEWIKNVQDAVNYYKGDNKDFKVCLVGHNKDESTFYLNLFPQWDYVETKSHANGVSATHIRNALFCDGEVLDEHLPLATTTFLYEWKTYEAYKKCTKDFDYLVQYSDTSKQYPRIEHTVDALVEQSGHVLLCKRACEHEEQHNPGANLWALPGGFLNVNERLIDGAIRELREETRLRVAERVLRGSLVNRTTFDDPNRELLRGRIITECFHFKLADGYSLPEVRGSDDVTEAKWFPIAHVLKMRTSMYADHLDIIKKMLGV